MSFGISPLGTVYASLSGLQVVQGAPELPGVQPKELRPRPRLHALVEE